MVRTVPVARRVTEVTGVSNDATADGLTQRDRDVLEAATDEPVQDDPANEQEIERLRERNREVEAEVQDLRDELTATKKTLFAELNKVKAELQGIDRTDPHRSVRYEDMTTLEKYQKLAEAEADDELPLGPSDRRAVLIFENWADWAKRVDAGEVISTNHTRGKYGKMAIKIDLEQETGKDLGAHEVYRAMKSVAKLSVTDPDDVQIVTDDYGREHITGGAFEYHEKVNPDATGQSRKFKVLQLADPDGVVFP